MIFLLRSFANFKIFFKSPFNTHKHFIKFIEIYHNFLLTYKVITKLYN